MTKYSYKCLDCDNTFDIQATIQEKEEAKGGKFMCPKCKSKNIKQKFSVTNFIKNVFKGDDKADGCCPGKNTCDNKKSCCN